MQNWYGSMGGGGGSDKEQLWHRCNGCGGDHSSGLRHPTSSYKSTRACVPIPKPPKSSQESIFDIICSWRQLLKNKVRLEGLAKAPAATQAPAAAAKGAQFSP